MIAQHVVAQDEGDISRQRQKCFIYGDGCVYR